MEALTARSASKNRKRTAASDAAAAAGAPAMRLEVLKQFRVLLRSIKRHYQWIERECGLSGAQLWALSEISAAPGIKVSELARELGIHMSTASNLLRRLEELEMVERQRIGEDHRVVQLRLTPKGEKILQLAPRPLVGLLQQALTELPQPRLASLHADLAEVISLMKFTDENAKAVPLSEI